MAPFDFTVVLVPQDLSLPLAEHTIHREDGYPAANTQLQELLDAEYIDVERIQGGFRDHPWLFVATISPGNSQRGWQSQVALRRHGSERIRVGIHIPADVLVSYDPPLKVNVRATGISRSKYDLVYGDAVLLGGDGGNFQPCPYTLSALDEMLTR